VRDVICDECGVEVAAALVSTFDGNLPRAYCDQHLVAWCMGHLASVLDAETLRKVAEFLSPPAAADPVEEKRPRRPSKSRQTAQETPLTVEPDPEPPPPPAAGADDARDPGDVVG